MVQSLIATLFVCAVGETACPLHAGFSRHTTPAGPAWASVGSALFVGTIFGGTSAGQ